MPRRAVVELLTTATAAEMPTPVPPVAVAPLMAIVVTECVPSAERLRSSTLVRAAESSISARVVGFTTLNATEAPMPSLPAVEP